jgi:hypothetical protein
MVGRWRRLREGKGRGTGREYIAPARERGRHWKEDRRAAMECILRRRKGRRASSAAFLLPCIRPGLVRCRDRRTRPSEQPVRSSGGCGVRLVPLFILSIRFCRRCRIHTVRRRRQSRTKRAITIKQTTNNLKYSGISRGPRDSTNPASTPRTRTLLPHCKTAHLSNLSTH